METNESILTRSIVGLDERKVLGKMSSLRVDYDTQAVSHYIVMNASTNNAIALPFENAIAVGDTFITVQSYGSFVDANSPASKELVSDSNKLVGVDTVSPKRTTVVTAPPRCAMPWISETLQHFPAALATRASRVAAVIVP